MNLAYKCDFRKDCVDGKDEDKECLRIFKKNLTCSNNWRNIKKNMRKCHLDYSSLGEIQTKVHKPYELLKNCSKNTICDIGYLKCEKVHYCVALHLVCDGIKHCTHGDDELECGS